MTVKIIFNNTNTSKNSIIELDASTDVITGINVTTTTSTIALTPTGWSTTKLNAFLEDFVKPTFDMTDGQIITVQILVDDIVQTTLNMTLSGTNYNIVTQIGDVVMTILTLNVDTLIQLFKLSNDIVKA